MAWYNKDSEARYIGFSDGIYDKDYDEDKYNAVVADYYRLSGQKSASVPDDKDALELSARLAAISSAIARMTTTMRSGSGVYGALQYLKSNFGRIRSTNKVVLFANKWDTRNKEITKQNQTLYTNLQFGFIVLL